MIHIIMKYKKDYKEAINNSVENEVNVKSNRYL